MDQADFTLIFRTLPSPLSNVNHITAWTKPVSTLNANLLSSIYSTKHSSILNHQRIQGLEERENILKPWSVWEMPGGGGVLPYKGLMGTCGQPGYVFRDFCLKQGIEFIIFCLNQGIDLSIFVLNRISFLGR